MQCLNQRPRSSNTLTPEAGTDPGVYPGHHSSCYCEHPGRVKAETDPVVPSRWPEKCPPPSPTVHSEGWEAGAVPGSAALTHMFQWGLDRADGNAWGKWEGCQLPEQAKTESGTWQSCFL